MREGREQKAGLTSLALLVMYVQTDLRSAAQTGFSASLSAPPPPCVAMVSDLPGPRLGADSGRKLLA